MKKIPLHQATKIALKFSELIHPCISKMEVCGGIRRQCKEVDSVVIVCVEKPSYRISDFFGSNYKPMVVDGNRCKAFQFPKDEIGIRLYITTSSDYGRAIALRTGSSHFNHIKLSTMWWKKGWTSTQEGLRKRQECERKGRNWVLKKEFERKPTLPPKFYSEMDFFNFLGIEYILPQDRNWTSRYLGK